MASIVKTPSHHWKAVVRVRGWPTTAKTFRLKRDAARWAQYIEDQICRGILPVAPKSTLLFADAMDRYLREISPLKAPRTCHSERGRAKTLKRFFGRYALSAITPELVARYRDSRLASPRASRNRVQAATLLAPATVRLELALLSQLYMVAIREWHTGMVVNPVMLIKLPSPSPGRTRRLGKGEERRLFAAARCYCNPMVAWITRIALETSMRLGEILGLHRDQVDLRRRLVHLHATKNGESRTVPLSLLATQTFTRALANRRRPGNCPYIFFGTPDREGKNAGPYSFRTAWNVVRTEARLGDLRFHDLRHEAISRFVEDGLSDQEVVAISGHRSMQMLRRYTHLRTEDLVKKLDHVRRRRVRG